MHMIIMTTVFSPAGERVTCTSKYLPVIELKILLRHNAWDSMHSNFNFRLHNWMHFARRDLIRSYLLVLLYVFLVSLWRTMSYVLREVIIPGVSIWTDLGIGKWKFSNI